MAQSLPTYLKRKASTIAPWLFGLSFVLLFSPAFNAPQLPAADWQAQLELGKKLFFDPILSLDSSISCGSCHQPQFAFADTAALSLGVGQTPGRRNAPSVMNMALRPYFFYDGRAGSLEAQAKGPIEDPLEMHLSYAEATQRVQSHPEYSKLFPTAFGSAPDSSNILLALAAFVRSLESNGSSPFDRWSNGSDSKAIDASAKRGRKIFLKRAKCFDCHFGPDFTGDEFRNIGLYDEEEYKDQGRFEITGDSSDLGKFKVPGLRNVALTAPYMHDGSFQTLEEVIDYYDDPYQFVENPINIDSLMLKPLRLSKRDKSDLLSFLRSLSDDQIPYR